ncbi:unnamed protein product [Brassica oleracea var. botrytis]
MNVSVAFPQKTPAFKFPPCRAGCAEESEGVHGERSYPHYDREFPFYIIPKLGALGVVRGSIKVNLFFNLVRLFRVMAVLASLSQPMPLQQQRYLELMEAVGLLICIGKMSLAWRRLWSSLALEKSLELKLLMAGACPWILFLHMFIVP